MNKRVRVSFSELQINVLLRLSSMELMRQITHNVIDPVMTETAMKVVKAKEKFMPGRKEEQDEILSKEI